MKNHCFETEVAVIEMEDHVDFEVGKLMVLYYFHHLSLLGNQLTVDERMSGNYPQRE